MAAALVLLMLCLLCIIATVSASTSSPPLTTTSTQGQQQQQQQRPNIVFLIDESTDGRTYRPSFEAIHLTNIRRLFSGATKTANTNTNRSTSTTTGTTTSSVTTVQFDTHYTTAPVCAASRASIWSGRYPHNIPHLQAKTGMHVNGAWNNFEGLPQNYSEKIHNVLNSSSSDFGVGVGVVGVDGFGGYDIKISGKTDWTTGGHSLDNRLSAWTMYTRFPYNTTMDTANNHGEGFANEYGMCTGNGTVTPSTVPKRGGYYANDWRAVNQTTAWIRDRGREQAAARERGDEPKPFFAYQGT